MAFQYRVRHGGLMRCCLQTLDEKMQELGALPEKGTVLPCRYHDDNGGMILADDGVWEWNRPETEWRKP
jgi:hypothetical protein